jgi:hypothetical protein
LPLPIPPVFPALNLVKGEDIGVIVYIFQERYIVPLATADEVAGPHAEINPMRLVGFENSGIGN